MTMKRFPIYPAFDHSMPPVGFVECDPAAIFQDSDFVLTLGGLILEQDGSGKITRFELRELAPIPVAQHSAVVSLHAKIAKLEEQLSRAYLPPDGRHWTELPNGSRIVALEEGLRDLMEAFEARTGDAENADWNPAYRQAEKLIHK